MELNSTKDVIAANFRALHGNSFPIYGTLTNRGHFTLGDMGTEKFPELRNELLRP